MAAIIVSRIEQQLAFNLSPPYSCARSCPWPMRSAAVVAISIFAACASLPRWRCRCPRARPLGTDPAFGSGPLATVIQDLLSILIYFGVAMLLLG